MAVSGLYLQHGIKSDFPDNGFHNGILFDTALRSTFGAETQAGREQASGISDVIWPLTQYFPVVVDGLFIPLVTDKFNADVALQISMLNWQAQGISFVLLRIAHRTVGRGRPHLSHCPNGPHPNDPSCNPAGVGNTASFYSGHSSMTAVAAGLSCAHHTYLPLMGDPMLDGGVCALMIASSLATGGLRVVADRHWTTDVLTGWLLGGAVGYGLPVLLHYGYPLDGGVLPKHTAVVPYADDDGGGLTYLGRF